MFSTSTVLLKRPIPAFGVFLKKIKNLPEIKACKTIPARGRLAGKLYAKLSAAEKEALKKEGLKGRK